MKRLAWTLAAILALLGLLGGGLFALASTAGGFRWLTHELALLSQGKLKIEGVEGHLLAPLAVRNLQITTATTRIRIEQARLEWRPRALWNRRLDIRLLAAQRVEVATLKPSVEPLQPPTSLRLPFGLALEPARIDVAQLDIRQAGLTQHFSGIKLDIVDRGHAWQFQLAPLASPWATARGQAQLGKDAPFALTAQVDAVREAPMAATAVLEVRGQLDAIVFKLDAAAQGMSFLASGTATPFGKTKLPHLLVVGQGIDPAQLSAGAPSASLAFSGVFELLPDQRLLGSFSLRNARSGKLDRGRLPLVELSGAVLGNTQHADVSDLKIDLGEAGQLMGAGQWRNGQFGLNLASERLNLAGLHGSLYPSRIRLATRLSGDAARQQLHAEVSESYGQGQFVLTHDANQLVLETLDFTGQYGSRWFAQGNLNLAGKRAFSARFEMSRFNPARFGNFPQARLNARGQISGNLAPGFSVKGQFELPPGELEGHPVVGRGRVNYAGGRLFDTEVDVNLAGNQAQLRGDYETSRMRANWRVHAPALARLGRLGLKHFGVALAGQLDSSGSVSGNPRQPQVKMEAHAKGLRLPGGIAADSLDLQLDLQASATGSFSGALLGHGLAVGGQTVSFARMDVQGQRNAHAIGMEVRLPGWRASLRAQGGLDAARVWRGRLLEADLQGAWPVRLLAPATLQLGREAQQIEAAEFSVAGGRLTLARLAHQAGRFDTRGSFTRLPLAPLLGLLDPAPPLTTDLLLNGEWAIRLADALDGQLALRRLSGDASLTDPALKLGLTALKLDVQSVANRVTAKLDIDTSEAGRIHAEGQTRVLHEAGKFVLPRTAPLDWLARASLPDLRLLRPLLPLGTRAGARLNLDLAGSGTLAAPVLNGTLAASDIRFSMPEEGIGIRDGAIKLKLDNNTVTVSEGVLEGQSGRIHLQGSAAWRNPAGGLTLNFENFAALTRSDRSLWLSGVTRLGYANGRVQLEGDLRADKARIEMPAAGRPRLSDDVVVLGREPRTVAGQRRVHLDLNLRFDLGEDFLFKGAGLDARLGGNIRILTRNDALQGEGRIQVMKGRYSTYGQTLDITRGILSFAGPLDNPSLDILAVRKTADIVKGDIVAGVKVTGTVERPLVSLYSDPAMPDTEKLSWLMFGHGLDTNDGAKFEMMQVMASALLSQAESASLQGKLADALAIDSFEVRGGEDTEDLSKTVVSVGKRINSKLTMNYEQSLDGLEQIVKAIYQLSSKLRVEAAAGSQSSLDLFYTLEFD